MARKITLTLTDPQEEMLRSCFSPDSKPLDLAKAQEVAQVALDCWLAILSGERRYRSLTDVYIEWLERIYTDILPELKPTYRYLYQRLNFSSGQALYLCRVLLDKQNSRWRTLARVELREALAAREAEAQQIIKNKGGYVQRLEFDLSKAARIELNVVLEDLYESGERTLSPPQPVGSYGDRGMVSIVAAMVPLLLKSLK